MCRKVLPHQILDGLQQQTAVETAVTNQTHFTNRLGLRKTFNMGCIRGSQGQLRHQGIAHSFTDQSLKRIDRAAFVVKIKGGVTQLTLAKIQGLRRSEEHTSDPVTSASRMPSSA